MVRHGDVVLRGGGVEGLHEFVDGHREHVLKEGGSGSVTTFTCEIVINYNVRPLSVSKLGNP